MTWQLHMSGAAMIAAIAAVLHAPAPSATEPAPQTAPSLPEPAASDSLPLEADRYQRMTVPVTIGGEGPFRFMIDTGAQATVLSRQLADRLNLFERDTAILVGMAGRTTVETTSVANLGFGSRRFHIQTAPLVDASYIGDADGVLGTDSLQSQRVLLDFVKRQILIADAEELGGNRGYEIIVKARRRLGQLIITQARFEGLAVSVIVDTGAQSSIGNLALLEKLRNRRTLGESTLTDINGQQLAGPSKIVRDLSVGRLSLKNFPVLFADSPPFHALGLNEKPAIILGMSELRLFRRVAIDFSSGLILFDLPRDVRGFDSMHGGIIGS